MKEIPQSNYIDRNGWKQNVLPGYENEISSQINQRKREILSSFFTNVDGRVTAVKDSMPGVLAATLTARFSRAQEPDVTELFWNEFVNNKELGMGLALGPEKTGSEILLTDKARKIIRKILDEYGDDSVREQASGYIMVKGTSVLTSMSAFRHPLITGIEASTRYINWADLSSEEFFVIPENLQKDPEAFELYSNAMESAHESYSNLWPILTEFISKKNPNTDPNKLGAYKIAIKGAVCDALRGLLPLGIKTNFGVHANYRTLSELVMNLRANGLEETREVASEMAAELSKVNPEFINIVDHEHGAKWTNYQKESISIAQNFARQSETCNSKKLSVGVELPSRYWLFDLVREAIISKNGGMSDLEVTKLSNEYLKNGKLEELLQDFAKARKNRRDKLPDFFDSIPVRVKIENLSFGAFKDLNRHRKLMCKSDPDFSGNRGFIVPEVIKEAGEDVSKIYSDAILGMLNAKRKLETKYPEESKLLLPHGAKTAFEMVIGLGEAYWISELRSIASGNSEYRKIAVEIYNGLIYKAPILEKLGSFVDTNDYALGRIREAVRADLKGK